MTEPAGDLSTEDIAQLRQQLAAYPRLPLIPDEQQGGDEDGPDGTYYLAGILVNSTKDAIAGGADHFEEIGKLHPDEATVLTIGAVNALPRLLAEIERRRDEDQALNLFRQDDGDLVSKLANLIANARVALPYDCDMCRGLDDMCSTHLAEMLINEVREQRLVILTAEAANEVVRDSQQRIERAERERDTMREVARSNKRHVATLSVLLERVEKLTVDTYGEDLDADDEVTVGAIVAALDARVPEVEGANR